MESPQEPKWARRRRRRGRPPLPQPEPEPEPESESEWESETPPRPSPPPAPVRPRAGIHPRAPGVWPDREKPRCANPIVWEPPEIIRWDLKKWEETDAYYRTSLKGLRQQTAAIAQEIAEEKRMKKSFGFVPPLPSSERSAFKPERSVLDNDTRQRLVKERREGRERLQHVDKERHIAEKDIDSRILYEKHIQEQQRKLAAQREKAGQRWESAQLRRRLKFEEERDKFRGILLQTLIRTNRIDLKRLSWEFPATKSRRRSVNRHPISPEKPEQENARFDKYRFTSSAGFPNPFSNVPDERSRISSLATKDMKPHACPEPEKPPREEKPHGIDILQHIRTSLRNQSNNELKPTVMAPQFRVIMPHQAKIEISPKVKVEVSPKVMVEVSPEVVVETTPKAKVEAFRNTGAKACNKANIETSPVEMLPKAGVAACPKAKVKGSIKKSEIVKKPASSNISRYRRPSSASRQHPPSPGSRQIQQNDPLSPLPIISRQSATSSNAYKVTPVRDTLCAPDTLISITKKRKDAVSKAINKRQAPSHKNRIKEEASVKSISRTMSVEDIAKLLSEKRSLAQEWQAREGEEDRARKEMQESVIWKMKVLAKKATTGLGGDFSVFEDDQRRKDMKTKKGYQNYQDRGIPSQASGTPGYNRVEADETNDDDGRTGSDDESLDEMASSAIFNDINMPHKLKNKMNTGKIPMKLTYLHASGDHIMNETKSFNSNAKIPLENAKDPLTQAKGSRPSLKKMVGHTTKTINSYGAQHTLGGFNNLSGEPQGWMCDNTIDVVGQTEPPLSSSDAPLDNQKGHVKDTIKFLQNPQMCFDGRKKNKPVSPHPEL
ncbi:MAP7 domain-containing protein 3-like isoform X3 [Elephas maximus indicus]|uniref:MAP7 domain-containing protein 3-like isoform X3 n=1 Tax=Elephas maximus indicus TaxID=99487 RepID=UPI002116384F|nr:MAP7 domain-containing protein 3-like isoform X3 [Elephas maximus indicus]